MSWAALVPLAFQIVRGLEGAFGKGTGKAKAAAGTAMLGAAATEKQRIGELDSVPDNATAAAIIEAAFQALKALGELGGAKAETAKPAPKDAGDNPPMQMSMPAGAVLTIQF